MTHKHIDYKPIHAKFLLLGLKQLSYPNTWSLRSVIQDPTRILPSSEAIIRGCTDHIIFDSKCYYVEDLNFLYKDICNKVKNYNDT